MTEKFNEYLVNLRPTLASNRQDIAGDHLALITNRPTDSMFIKPTDEQKIKLIVRDLLPNKSPDHVDISPRVARAVIDQISAPLYEICNKSFQTGLFPDKLKLAKVIPFFKSENKSFLNNYRPISVRSPFSENMPCTLLINLYFTLIHHYLDYCNVIWADN